MNKNTIEDLSFSFKLLKIADYLQYSYYIDNETDANLHLDLINFTFKFHGYESNQLYNCFKDPFEPNNEWMSLFNWNDNNTDLHDMSFQNVEELKKIRTAFQEYALKKLNITKQISYSQVELDQLNNLSETYFEEINQKKYYQKYVNSVIESFKNYLKKPVFFSFSKE